jgi:hypothetical protein
MRHSILVCLLVAGCSDYTFQGHKGNNDNGDGDTDPDVVAGPQPDIEVDPMVLTFGGRPIHCPSEPQTVTVSNVGEEDLDISDMALDGQGSSSFTLDGAGPIVLGAGDSMQFTVSFEPGGLQDYAVPVKITSNDPDESRVDVELSGTGAEDAFNEEVFTQNSPSNVDVLWIIDNSGSMAEEVGALQDSFDVFIQSFVNLGLNYHIAATTTDMFAADQSGKFQGPIKVIDTSLSQSDAIQAFEDMTDLGSGGSGDEKGLDAAYAALTSPLVGNYNAGFLRPNAVLSVIVLSDEDDHSAITQPDFRNWLNGMKSSPDDTSLSAIVGDHTGGGLFNMGGCLSGGFPPRQAEAGDIYIDMAADTGGMWGSICDLDFDGVLRYLSYNAAGLITDFVLAETPSNIADIVVTVEGNAVPYNGVTGWTWKTDTNAIHFNGDSIPAPGDTIIVQYPVSSECN